VALYIGMQGNKGLEQKFRESLGVSKPPLISCLDVLIRRGIPLEQVRSV